MDILPTLTWFGSITEVEWLVWRAQGLMCLTESLHGYQLIPGSMMVPWILAFSGLMDLLERERLPLRTPSPGPARTVESLAPASSVRVTMRTAVIPNLSLPRLPISSGSFSLHSRMQSLQFSSQIAK